MAITVGDAILWLRGNDSKLDGDLKKTEAKTQGVLSRISAQFKESMNFAIGQVMERGLNQLAAGIENMASEIIDLGQTYAQQVEDMARLSGASIEDASRIIQISDDMRLSYDQVSTALKMYARQAAESGEASDMSIETLARLSDQYLSLAPGVERANFLLENFGRSGADMGKLMEQGGAGIREMAAAVDESLVMTQEGIDAAEEYRLAMDDWNDALDGVKLELAKTLLPVLKDFALFAKDTLIPIIKDVVNWFSGLPAPARNTLIAVGGLIVALVKLGPAFMGIAGIISLLGGGGGAAAGAAGAAAGGGLLGWLTGALGGLAGFITGTVIPALGTFFVALGTFFLSPVGLLILAIGALAAVIYIFWDDAWKTIQNIAEMWPKILKAAWDRIIFEVKKWITNFLTQIKTLAKLSAKEWLEAGKAIPRALWNGIQAEWEWLKTQLKNAIDSLIKAFDLKLEIKSPSKVFKWRGEMMAQGIGLGFTQTMADQVRQDVMAGVRALIPGMGSDNRVSVGTLEMHSTLTMTERKLLLGAAKEHSTKQLLSELRRINRP